MNAKLNVFIILLTLGLCATLFAQAGPGGGNGFPGFRNGMGQGAGNLLTDEQKQELHDLISGMRQDGATREEIKEAVADLFDEWGIEQAENPEGESWHRNWRGVGDPQLTDEQRETLRTTIREMRQAGATREEIKAAVEALYAEWGLDMPERQIGRASCRERVCVGV